MPYCSMYIECHTTEYLQPGAQRNCPNAPTPSQMYMKCTPLPHSQVYYNTFQWNASLPEYTQYPPLLLHCQTCMECLTAKATQLWLSQILQKIDIYHCQLYVKCLTARCITQPDACIIEHYNPAIYPSSKLNFPSKIYDRVSQTYPTLLVCCIVNQNRAGPPS